MKRFITNALVLVAVGISTSEIKAQSAPGNITGQVKDDLSGQGLPNASIVLKRAGDGKLVNTLTDTKGTFRFDNLQDGLYTLTIDYIGYKSYRKDSVLISQGTASTDKLPVSLVLDQKSLKGVTVKAARPYIVMKSDRVVVNVAESPVAAGGDALQVLSRAPGVTDDGGLQLRGKKVVVLVDGKDSRLSGDELKEWLSAMPGNSIDRIELVTNPGAKYDARGGAVINIITAKNKNFGTNGTVTVGTGFGVYPRYNGGISLNHRSRKLNLFGSYDYQYSKQYADLYSDRTLDKDNSIFENTNETRTRNSHALKIGADYDINKRNTLGLLVKGTLNYRDRAAFNRSVQDNLNNPQDPYSTVSTDGRMRVWNPSVNLYYKSILDSTGRQLTVNADYFSYQKTWKDDFTTRFYDQEGQEQHPAYVLRDNSPANNTIASVAADYSQPVKKGSLEAGVKATFTRTDNDVLWEQLTGKYWETDKGKTNHFIYKENIFAAYANYSRSIGKVSMQLGLRAEQTATEGNSVTYQQVTKRDYLNIFPSVALMYEHSAKHQFGISYRQSIDRFSFDVVNPFVRYISQYFYYQGNPYIKPSVGHNVEVNYSYNDELMASVGYQHYNDALASVYQKDSNNVVTGTDVNLKSGDAITATLTHSKAYFNGLWISTNTAMLMYAKYNEPGAGQLSNAGTNVYVNTNNMFKLPGGFSAELSGTYISPMVFGVYRFRPQYYVDAGISKSILNKTGKLTLNVTDIFNTRARQYDISSFGVQSYYSIKEESRFVKLIFSYRFGNQQVKSAKVRKAAIEKEQRRMESN
ncbi:MAG TPA: TonB dependent receptor [Chitinophaga sp.]|uniref:TonB dependent receptor n=1 Tax=Chitinophaga sp. TaxID=1869181 RepID=UPI002C5DA09F|nr:TonB dependent receptor [Chitinophaga sp.]HVI46011.1 TonB dependent receptor [Chitinophaga sp.]